MLLIDRYQLDVAEGRIQYDSKQFALLQSLDFIREQVIQKRSWWHCFSKKHSIRGLYIWGGVGIGKTYLMDLFCHALPNEIVLRRHFHAFMKEIHTELKIRQGSADPLKIIAKVFSKKTRVLCFDEFFVNDISDAMLLGKLFEALFDAGVILIATSNISPDELYRNGLQRAQFLPAIELIKEYCEVIHLTIKADYRLEKLKSCGVFFSPLTTETAEHLENLYLNLTCDHEQLFGSLIIHDRSIEVVKRTQHVVWFEFNVICKQPRSQMDYLKIADEFDVVIISNIPIMTAEDQITYFIYLVDIFYDHKVKLILSTAVSVDSLYAGQMREFDYQRTLSRLEEMQSEQYLHDQHVVNSF